MSRLDEPSLRRPAFRDGYRIELADGQAWTFPAPQLRFFPARAADGRVSIASLYAYDDRYLELREELVAVDRDDAWNAMRLQVEIAGTQLLANYDLSSRDLARLLPVIPDSAENDALWDRLVPVILAQEPRTFRDGSAAPV